MQMEEVCATAPRLVACLGVFSSVVCSERRRFVGGGDIAAWDVTIT